MGDRQRACSETKCQEARRKKTQAAWRAAHPDYFVAHRLEQRAAQAEIAKTEGSGEAIARPPPPLRVPPPLNQLPWDLAQDEFGVQGADFLGVFGRVLLGAAKDQRSAQAMDSS